MKTRILIANHTRAARVRTLGLRRCARVFLEHAAARGLQIDELSIAVTDDAGIAPLNQRFVRHRGPTDVISFLLAPPPGRPHGCGEVVLNAEQAMREARARRLDPSRELAWYLAHGIHHLTGAIDSTPARRAAMHCVERAWIADAAKRGVIAGMCEPQA